VGDAVERDIMRGCQLVASVEKSTAHEIARQWQETILRAGTFVRFISVRS
jgi:hypothetical protein